MYLDRLCFLLGCFDPTDTTSLNMKVLIERFASDVKCRDLLEELRWPRGTVA